MLNFPLPRTNFQTCTYGPQPSNFSMFTNSQDLKFWTCSITLKKRQLLALFYPDRYFLTQTEIAYCGGTWCILAFCPNFITDYTGVMVLPKPTKSVLTGDNIRTKACVVYTTGSAYLIPFINSMENFSPSLTSLYCDGMCWRHLIVIEVLLK